MDEASQQKGSIKECQQSDLFRKSKTLFLINAQWWTAWKKYVGYDGEPSGASPGPIDNSALIGGLLRPNDWSQAHLREDLRDHTDFEYLAPTAWRRLLHWYGGSPPVEVFLIDCVPDFHPVPVAVWVVETANDYSSPKEYALVSLRMTVLELHRYLCERQSLPYHKYNLQVEDLPNPDPTARLEDLAVGYGSRVYIVMQGAQLPAARVSAQFALPERTTPSSRGDTQDDSDTDVDMMLREILPADRKEVESRIAAAYNGPKVRLGVRDISKTEKAVSSLWLDFQHKDLI